MLQPDLQLTLNKKSAADPLRLRFFDDEDFDEDDLWDFAIMTTSAGEPRAVVADIDEGGLAYAAGLRMDDAVIAVGGQTDLDRETVRKLLKEAKGAIVLSVRREECPAAAPAVNASPSMHDPRDATSRRSPPSAPSRGASSSRPKSAAYTAATPGIHSPALPSPGGHAAGVNAAPVTPRAFKSSLQLHKELREVGDTMEKMTRKVTQALAVVRGTRGEVEACVISVRKSLQLNPSLSEDLAPAAPSRVDDARTVDMASTSSPRSSVAAQRAAERAAATREAEKKMRLELGRAPEREEVEPHIEAELHRQRKERRRREQVNRPVVEALDELEELALNGCEKMAEHEAQLEHQKELLEEVYNALGNHYHARDKVVNAPSRTNVTRLDDHPTHEVLSVASEREDTARHMGNVAMKAARAERSTIAMQKAEVQRAARLRGEMIAQFRRDDLRGTSFKGWSREELKVGR